MKLGTLIKTLIELFIIGFILFGVCAIVLYSFGGFIFSYFGYHSIISTVFDIIACFILLFFFAIFIYVYKDRYFNYYLREKYKNKQIDDLEIKDVPQEEKKIEFKNEKIDFKNEEPKFIIRDRKESTFVITLVQIISICTKAFIITFIAPWVLLAFIFLIFLLVICIYLIFYNFLFFGVSIALLGAIVITGLIAESIFVFLVNKRVNTKRYGIMFLVSLIAIGVGSGLSVICFNNLEVKNVAVVDTYEEKFEYSDNLNISTDESTLRFFIDNSIDDIKLEVKYNKDVFAVQALLNKNKKDYDFINIDYEFINDYNAFTYIKTFINNIKNNIIIVDDYEEISGIYITSNEANIKNLIKNISRVNRVSVYERKDGYLVNIVDIVHEDDVCTLNKKGYYECVLVDTDNFCEYNVDEYNNITAKDKKNCICEKYSNSAYSCHRKMEDYIEE